MELCSKEEDKLLEILDQGAAEAQAEAEKTLKFMKDHVGILRRKL